MLMRKGSWKGIMGFIIVMAGFLFLMPGLCLSEEILSETEIRATPYSMDFFGTIDGVMVGDRVTVADPDGVLCGEFVINKAGQYGFLHVYGDDPGTAEDEGAQSGDFLTFMLNGEPLESSEVYWIGDRMRERVDFGIK